MWQLFRGITIVLTPLREWHGSQNKTNRSADASWKWYAAASGGACYEPLRTMAKLCTSSGWLEEMGMERRDLPAGLTMIDALHPLIVAETNVVSSCGELVLSVLGRRSRSVAWHDATYPGLFPGLLDETTAPKVLTRMQEDDAAWALAQKDTSPFWQKLVARSVFQWSHTKMIFALARAEKWICTPRFETIVKKQWSGVTQAKIVEDGVHEARCGEVSKNFKRKLSPMVCWDALAHGGLASKVHHFKDVGTGGQVLCCV